MIGIAAALVVVFLIWIIWRGWTSKARHGLKSSAGMDALYENSKVVDVDFKDILLPAFAIDPTLDHACGLWKLHHWNYLWYCIGCVSSMYYFWGLISDGLAFRSMYATGRQSEAVFYAATVVISLVLIGYDVYQAYRILHLDDVSDGFLNADVVRYRSLSLLQHNFLKKLGEGVKCSDKLALFLFNSLINAPRLAFVEVPQLVLVIVAHAKSIASLEDRCGVNFASTGCTTSECTKCADEHGPDGLSTVGLAIKGVFLAFALYQFCLSAFLYPFFRGILKYKFSELGGKDFTLTGYCSYLIDLRICELLLKTPNSVPPDFWEKRGRTPDGEKKSLKEKASDVHQAAIAQVQETKSAIINQVEDTKAAAVGQVIDIKDSAQEKLAAGKDAVKNVFGTSKGVLNVLIKKESDAT